MSSKKDGAAIAGIGAAACAACCAGPILGFLSAIGLGTLTGVVLFGVAGLLVAAIGAAILVARGRRRSRACATAPEIVAVDMPTIRS
jgi:hypothetical protein